MPYKDPERKRQWEQAHRTQRSEQRRLQRDPTTHAPSAWNVSCTRDGEERRLVGFDLRRRSCFLRVGIFSKDKVGTLNTHVWSFNSGRVILDILGYFGGLQLSGFCYVSATCPEKLC